MNVQRYVKGEKRVFRIKDILDEKRKRSKMDEKNKRLKGESGGEEGERE